MLQTVVLGRGVFSGQACAQRPRQRVAAARAVATMAKQTVVVTGAGGRTGRLIFEKLKSRPDQFDVRAVVRCVAACVHVVCVAPAHVLALKRRNRRTAESKKALGDANVYVVDISSAASSDALKDVFRGCDALVIATSATPVRAPLLMNIASWLACAYALRYPFCFLQKMTEPPKPGERPNFVYPPGGLPEAVDWVGQKAQIDAAKAAGIKKVVTIGSRGGTQPAEKNMLNQIGGAGTNILVWKRKAEQYLVDSGLDFTIIRAGGLLGEDKPGGKRTLVVGADDADLGARSVPRADVAEVAVQALSCADASRRSMDLVSREEGDGAPTSDFAALFRACKVGM